MKTFKLKLEIANMTSSKIPAREFFVKIARRTLELINSFKKIEMELAFVDEAEMRKLNRIWRGENRVTDVLSFSGVNQIIICLTYAKKMARQENLTQNQELAMLFVHGILHILGYDHERSKKEEKAMWEVQNKILSEF